MEDADKVKAKLNELNAGDLKGPWAIAEGLHALTAFKFDNPGQNEAAEFNPASGVPVKLFVHKRTGELKMFSAFLFRRDSNDKS